MNRIFVARQPVHVESMIAFVRANWEAMARDGRPLAARFSVYRKDRSAEQNSLMWVWLEQISRDVWVAGRQFDCKVWNEHAKRELLPETCAKGVDKWTVLPTGERVLAMSTTDLNVAEMGDYLDRLSAWAAVEHGVELHVLGQA